MLRAASPSFRGGAVEYPCSGACGSGRASDRALYVRPAFGRAGCHVGWPLADEGSQILWKGNWKLPEREGDDKIFNEKNIVFY